MPKAVTPARRVRRTFSSEFKQEAVRQLRVRRSQGVTLQQISRELEVSPNLLRLWATQWDAQGPRPVSDIFPGQGRLPSEAEELRRLHREVQRLQLENSFLKAAAAYFAKESR